jgi:hypothetical protein
VCSSILLVEMDVGADANDESDEDYGWRMLEDLLSFHINKNMDIQKF